MEAWSVIGILEEEVAKFPSPVVCQCLLGIPSVSVSEVGSLFPAPETKAFGEIIKQALLARMGT